MMMRVSEEEQVPMVEEGRKDENPELTSCNVCATAYTYGTVHQCLLSLRADIEEIRAKQEESAL